MLRLTYIRRTMSFRSAAGPPSESPPPARSAPNPPPWQSGQLDPSLAAGALHVWRVELPAVDDEILSLLSPAEQERMSRIARERERRLWGRSRGVLRTLLARYRQSDPRKLALSAGPHGKPELSGGRRDASTGPSFSLSHSQHLAVYAFVMVGSVGIDVEVARPGDRAGRDHVALAKRSFGIEQARRLAELDPRRREAEFLRLWTRYEAELKRRGDGIGAGLARAEQAPWLAELDVGPDAAAAVACATAPRELRCWDWI